MSIIKPDYYSFKDTQSVNVYGEALPTYGLQVRGTSDGFGLVSRGLLWELQQVWSDFQTLYPFSTSWSNSDSVITTTWSAISGASITTNWSNLPDPS